MTAAADGNTISAKNLLKACTTPEMHWVDFCNGYFQAVHDSGSVAGKVCSPSGTTRTRLVTMFENKAPRLLQANPAIADYPGVAVALELMAREYPCQQ
jgi:hypothetical protein